MNKIISAILLLSYVAYARISVMYAHEKISDIVAEQCLTEMFPKGKRIELQESDESCIIYCVLKKLGIINSNGQFNLDVYRSYEDNFIAYVGVVSFTSLVEYLDSIKPHNKGVTLYVRKQYDIYPSLIKVHNSIELPANVIYCESKTRKRVQQAHQLDSHNLMNDKGSACVESAEATQHKQDVCKKAKVFNDCTHLYRMLFK